MYFRKMPTIHEEWDDKFQKHSHNGIHNFRKTWHLSIKVPNYKC